MLWVWSHSCGSGLLGYVNTLPGSYLELACGLFYVM